LWTRTVRFSNGTVFGRPEESWRFHIFEGSVPEVIARLRQRGFSALCLSRKAYADNADEIVKALAAAGYARLIEDDLREQVCVVLD
jgi:hypothetical protein